MKTLNTRIVVGANILRLLKRNDETQLDLAKRLGVSPSTVSSWCTGEKMPRMDKVDAMAEHFCTTRTAILSDSNSVVYDSNTVPLLGRIACGDPILAEQNVEEYISLPSGVRADYALTCRGESMTGAGIQNGDTVFIRSQPIVDNGQIAAVRVGENATLKRFKRTDNGIILMPENPECDPIIYDPDGCQDVEILGLAVAYLHKLV